MTELMKVTLNDIGALFARVAKLEAMFASLAGEAVPAKAPVPEATAPEKTATDPAASEDELRKVVARVASQDTEKARAILARFGAGRVSDVAPEDKPALLKAFKEAL